MAKLKKKEKRLNFGQKTRHTCLVLDECFLFNQRWFLFLPASLQKATENPTQRTSFLFA